MAEATRMTSAERLPSWPFEDRVSAAEQARRQGVKPLESAVPGLFDDDEEYEEFLADLYASRQAGLA
jgi:hypothetical protein